MWRNFDNHDVYFDLEGKPLHGAVQFNLKDGTTPAAIYDSDSTPLANPQLTDAYGKTEHQVFVDADVRAYFYKYVGEGPMASVIEEDGVDLSDESNWQLLYTVESAAIDERSITGESAAGVATMDALRALDPYEVPVVDGNRVVTLYGYFEANDKEPVNYHFVEQSEQPDDNGAVIQPDEMRTGRWVMVQPTEHCDSRHYGVFPQDSASSTMDHTTGIEQLVTYCNSCSLRPFFNGSADYPYFIYTALAVESLNPIDVSAGTQFVDKGTSSRFYGEWNGNPYFVNNRTDLRCATVKHSWNSRNNLGVVDYIADGANRPVVASGVNVVIVSAPASGSYLTGCTVESVHRISNSITMADMEVKESWFSEGYDWSGLSIQGCSILLKNFESADTYVLLKNKQNEADYGDLGEQEVHGAVFLDNAVVENFSGTCTCRGSAEIHNASATVTFSGSNPTLNAIDSWLTVTVAGGPFGTLAMRRGQIVSSATVSVLTAARFDDVDIDAPLSILGGSLVCTGSRINMPISHIGDPVVEDIRDCVFNAQIQIRGGGTDVLVNAQWVGNTGRVQDPISIDRTNINPDDSAHTYMYEGNTGTFVYSATAILTFVASADYVPGTPNRITAFYTAGAPIYSALHGETVTVSDGEGGYTDDPAKYVTKAKMFTVGTTGVSRYLDVVPSTPIVRTGDGVAYLAGSTMHASTFDHAPSTASESLCATLLFDSGYTWKVRNITVPCSALLEAGTNISLSIRERQ